MLERLGQDNVGLASIAVETFGARRDIPLAACLERVRAADALVVIVGHRYGWVPTVDEGGDGTKSITWLEVTWALDAGKPVYAFLVDPVALWSGEKEQDRLIEAKSDEDFTSVVRAVQGLKAFRAFLESKTTRELFTSADDLGGKVATSLAPQLRKWLADTATPNAAAPRNVTVFLCHSSSDKSSVRELDARLKADGFVPWLDERDILPGEDWERAIRAAVKKSDVVVVCLSKNSVSKVGFLQREINFVLDAAEEQPEGAIFILPVKLESCDVPERLARWQWLNYFEKDAHDRLLTSLRKRAAQLIAG